MCTCVLNEIKTAPQNKTGHCENQIRPPGGTGPFMHVATQKGTARIWYPRQGKPTQLSFDYANEEAGGYRMLLLDTCSQRNFSQNVFGDAIMDFRQTLYDALVVEITNAGN